MSEKNKEEIKTTSQPTGAREFAGKPGSSVVWHQPGPEDVFKFADEFAAQQTAALTDKLCKIQDDIASLVSTYRSDWNWNDVVEDVKKLVEHRDSLKFMLTIARNRFRVYAELHLAKGTPDSLAKSISNSELAERCNAVLEPPK